MIKLTSREFEVARLVAEKKSNKQIAELLGITLGTAKVHVQHIMGKLDVESRVDIGEVLNLVPEQPSKKFGGAEFPASGTTVSTRK